MKRDPEFIEFVKACCQGNEVAADFAVTMTEVAHFFDDLYDGDQRSKGDILNILWMAMVSIPRNEFYRKYFAELQPLVANAIVNWRVANALEETPTGEVDFRVAFVVRSSYADLIQQTALICGGPDWAAKVGVEVRRRCHSEPWKDYIESVEVSHGVVQQSEAARREPGSAGDSTGQRTDRAGTDRARPRAVRVVETERSAGPAATHADLPATDEAG